MSLIALTAALAAMSGGALPSPSAASSASNPFPIACSFGSRSDGLDFEQSCAANTPAGLSIAPAVLAAMAYDRGLATIAIQGSWYYRRRDGRMMRMMTFDMGPDYFVGGLARAIVDGKLAYVDRRLHVRLRTRYDWGEPFAGNRAEVCVGCVETKLDGGEHSMMTGGRWWVIDRRGREIAPVIGGR